MAACAQVIKQKLISSWDSVHWLGEQASNTKIKLGGGTAYPKKETIMFIKLLILLNYIQASDT